MLDPRFIEEHPDALRKALADRRAAADLDRILALRTALRARQGEVETMRAELNRTSKGIGHKKRSGADTTAEQELMKELKVRIKQQEEGTAADQDELDRLLAWIPNLPDSDVPVGADESANRLVRTHGRPRTFDFDPAPHWEIGERLGILAMDQGARVAGSGFPVLRGPLARLERVLIGFMLDLHTTEHGYVEIAPPILVNRRTMFGTGQLPKLEDDMYRLAGDDLFLIPTAEVPVTNLHQGEILAEEDLPLYYAAFTPNFRREAGAAGRDTRGLIRVHQFSKVELVKIVHPDASEEELEKLLADAEEVLRRLEIPYRVMALCTGDLSFASAKTYDLEIHAPGVDRWLEVSSVSNFRDFQARRIDTRFREKSAGGKKGKVRHVHTLNGSGVALPRLLCAVMENYQTAEGAIVVPPALRERMGCQKIEP